MFLESISPVQPALRAWRRTRATRSLGTWAWPDFPMAVRGMAPAALGVTTVCQHVARVLVAHGGWAGWGVPGSCRGHGDIRSKAGERKLPRELSLECIMHLSGLSAFVGPRANKARSRLLVVCAHMRRCLWYVKTLLWQPPYSSFHKT